MGNFSSCWRSTMSCFGQKRDSSLFRRQQSESIVKLQENGTISIEKFPSFGRPFESRFTSLDVPTVIEGNVDASERHRLTTSQSLESLASTPRHLLGKQQLNRTPTSLSSSPISSRLEHSPLNPSQRTRWCSRDSTVNYAEFTAPGTEPNSPTMSRPKSHLEMGQSSLNADISLIGPSTSGANRRYALEMLQRRNPELFTSTMESLASSSGATDRPLKLHESEDYC